jgi:hypothetical protein
MSEFSEETIQNAMFLDASGRGQQLIVPNVYLYNWEADLISVSKAGLVNEYEVKISVEDYERDQSKANKHYLLSNRVGDVPNYFWYVVPEGLIKPRVVPKYAGLIYVDTDGSAEVQRGAPRLHSRHITDTKRSYLARGLMYRYWKMRDESIQ